MMFDESENTETLIRLGDLVVRPEGLIREVRIE